MLKIKLAMVGRLRRVIWLHPGGQISDLKIIALHKTDSSLGTDISL